MDSEEFRKRGKEMIDYIADCAESLHRLSVVPFVKPGFLRKQLPEEAPPAGEEWDAIMKDVATSIIPGLTNWQHPRFHAFFPAGNSYPSLLGELLSAAMGCNGFSWAASPACTELEMVVMDWLGKMIGLTSTFLHSGGVGGGVIQGSASECVLVTMLAARKKVIDDVVVKFPYVEKSSFGSRLVAYCSSLAHSCVEKAANICQIQLRQLDPDERYSLRGDVLRKAIEEDKNRGLIPFLVIATLGTTSVCSSDSVGELSRICGEYRIWFHVEAAYGGNALICPEFQYLISDGLENVESINFNPNKWMLVNFDCSCMWVRNKILLETTFCVDPLYLKHEHQSNAIDFRNWGLALSRRFRSLKLWFVLRSYGVSGLQRYIREHVRLARKFESLLRKDDRFEVVAPVIFGLVCFRLQGKNALTEKLLSLVNAAGKLFMVPAKVKDKFVIRFVVCAPNAKDEDIQYAWDVVSEFAKAVLKDHVEEELLPLEESAPTDFANSLFVQEDDDVFIDENILSSEYKHPSISATKRQSRTLCRRYSLDRAHMAPLLRTLSAKEGLTFGCFNGADNKAKHASMSSL